MFFRPFSCSQWTSRERLRLFSFKRERKKIRTEDKKKTVVDGKMTSSLFSLSTRRFYFFFCLLFGRPPHHNIRRVKWRGWRLVFGLCVCVFQCLKGPETAVVDFSCRNVLMFIYFSFFFALLLCRRPVCLLILFSLLFQSGGWTIASRSSDSLILRQQCLFCVTLAGRRVCYSTTVRVFVNKLSLVLQARELSLGIGR